MLRLIVDNKPSFEKYIAKARVLENAFEDSQLNYAPLIWLFCKKSIYFKMQKIHHKTLRIIYQSDESYENLLNLDKSVSLHQRPLKFLVTEVFKSVSKTNSKFMWSYFSSKNLSYILGNGPCLSLPSVRSTVYGTNSVHFKGTFIWNNLPYFAESTTSVFEFKRNLKTLGSIDCSCLICKS